MNNSPTGNKNEGNSPKGNSLIDPVADWLIEQALGTTTVEKLLDQCALRLNAAGVPIWRANISFQILHPLYRAMSLTWYRGVGIKETAQFTGDVEASEFWLRSPQYFLVTNNIPYLSRKISGPDANLDFDLLKDLAEEGATEYLGYLVRFTDDDYGDYDQNGVVGSWVTDRPSGFSDDDNAALFRIQQRLAVACKMVIKETITKNVLSAYLGPDAGKRVLDGQIKLGDGDTIHSVIWFSDLRDSSGLADTLPPDEFLVLVNNYFQCMAGAVLENGGEVLRFIGDAVLAIFPIGEGGFTEQEACAKAVSAARDAVERMKDLNLTRKDEDKPSLGFGIGLHVGDVIYGNIGVPERVEFSVIGPAANEAARIETLTKSLNHQVIFSEHFAAALEENWQSLGKHELRGVGDPMEVFYLDKVGK